MEAEDHNSVGDSSTNSGCQRIIVCCFYPIDVDSWCNKWQKKDLNSM